MSVGREIVLENRNPDSNGFSLAEMLDPIQSSEIDLNVGFFIQQFTDNFPLFIR